jgi:hypothetical protein
LFSPQGFVFQRHGEPWRRTRFPPNPISHILHAMRKNASMPQAAITMDRKAFRVVPLSDAESDLRYWLERTPRERLEGLEWTRKILYGYGDSHPRFQKVITVIKLPES